MDVPRRVTIAVASTPLMVPVTDHRLSPLTVVALAWTCRAPNSR